MLGRRAASFAVAILVACLPVLAQDGYQGGRGQDRGNNSYQNNRDRRDNRGNDYGHNQYRGNQNFYNGVREGGRGGQYYDQRRANDDYRANEDYNRRDDNHRGGIGAGKGALIGGAGGAVLGAIFGGGLKGSLIGGAAGAGIGAIAGGAAQHSRDSRDSHDHH